MIGWPSTGSSHRSLRHLIVFVAVLALFAVEVPLAIGAHVFTVANTGTEFIDAAPFVFVGLRISGSQPANPVGWLLVAFAVVVVLGACAGDYSVLAYRLGHRSLPLRYAAAIVTTLAAVIPIILLAVPIMLYPMGGSPSGGGGRSRSMPPPPPSGLRARSLLRLLPATTR